MEIEKTNIIEIKIKGNDIKNLKEGLNKIVHPSVGFINKIDLSREQFKAVEKLSNVLNED